MDLLRIASSYRALVEDPLLRSQSRSQLGSGLADLPKVQEGREGEADLADVGSCVTKFFINTCIPETQ